MVAPPGLALTREVSGSHLLRPPVLPHGQHRQRPSRAAGGLYQVMA